MKEATPSVVSLQNMALENAALEPQSTWFLHARSGNLLLRLRNTLHIGEDASGDLVLAPAPSEALLTITLEQKGLQLKCARSGWLLQDDVSEDAPAASQSLTLTSGDPVALSLPNNQFTLAGSSLHHSPITRHISLSVEPEIPTLEVEVVFEPSPKAMTTEALEEPANPLAREAQVSDDAFHEPILIQEAADFCQSEVATAAAEPTPAPAAAPAAVPSTKRSFQPNRVALAVMIAGLLLAIYFTTDTQRSTLTDGSRSASDERAFPREQTLQLLGSTSSTISEGLPQPAQTPIATMQDIDPAIMAVPVIRPNVRIQTPAPAAATPIAMPATTSSTAVPDPDIRQTVNLQLAEAEQLIAAGNLVDAGDTNAIKTLTRVLNTDPTNERGLALIYQCAMLLLDQARAANDAGDEFLARNLTEEVLAFHPTLPEALALRSQLWAQ